MTTPTTMQNFPKYLVAAHTDREWTAPRRSPLLKKGKAPYLPYSAR
jgi:hypothetical protein